MVIGQLSLACAEEKLNFPLFLGSTHSPPSSVPLTLGNPLLKISFLSDPLPGALHNGKRGKLGEVSTRTHILPGVRSPDLTYQIVSPAGLCSPDCQTSPSLSLSGKMSMH